MERPELAKDLLELEKQFWQAIKDKDAETATRLTDEPCIVAGAEGIGSIDRKSMSEMIQAPPYALKDFELQDDVQLRMLSDDIAILAYKVHEELTVDGKPVTIDAADASTWVRRDGRWLCAMHTESIAGDPFGRDRMRA